MNELVVFGAGGHAREIIALVRDLNAAWPPEAQWRLVGVLTDRPEWSLPREMHLPRLGAIEWLEAHPQCSVVVAIGNPAAREDIVTRIRGACGNAFATLGPGVTLCGGATAGRGCELGANAVVLPRVGIGPGARLGAGAVAARAVAAGATAVGIPAQPQ